MIHEPNCKYMQMQSSDCGEEHVDKSWQLYKISSRHLSWSGTQHHYVTLNRNGS
jgi:hypothetical protein